MKIYMKILKFCHNQYIKFPLFRQDNSIDIRPILVQLTPTFYVLLVKIRDRSQETKPSHHCQIYQMDINHFDENGAKMNLSIQHIFQTYL